MKSFGLKSLQLFLVLAVIASGSAYACTGSESCSMPCCRHSAKDTNHHGADGNARGCCETTGSSAGATGTACRLDAKDFAAHPEIKTGAGLSACIVTNAGDASIGRMSFRAPAPSREPIPHLIPIFLQVQALLI
ncbi:MAG TPA: hypothetical protein VLR50_11785 [Desulfobacterales bacterium]|nr:hypothetical protein [Desulfobacterales bacterium]